MVVLRLLDIRHNFEHWCLGALRKWIKPSISDGSVLGWLRCLRSLDHGHRGRSCQSPPGEKLSHNEYRGRSPHVIIYLQTFGLIFGLSDAMIGLTIFAAGNSLSDLVANMSVAVSHQLRNFCSMMSLPDMVHPIYSCLLQSWAFRRASVAQC